MATRTLERVWEQLRGKKPHLQHFLDEVRLTGIRGFDGLRIPFTYPVTVIAGGNASGKTTVLFAAACAYKVPSAGYWDFRPATLFPNYRPKKGEHRDDLVPATIDYEFATPEGRRSMRWRRGKKWNQSFFGRKGAQQPRREVYLRTLSNLTNPTEVRSVLQMSRSSVAPQETPLTPVQITFAQNLLPFDYSAVTQLTNRNKKLLFATQASGAAYSEFHMAAGERAILRLSQEIAHLKDALVLIDEIEAGLHPWVQHLLMLHFQQIAVRNDLQIVVTSHSPVILDSVPPEGRVILDRDSDGRVSLTQPYRDIIQNAMYGRLRDRISVLCEDDAAEGILRGIVDFLAPQGDLKHETINIGRDTGASEFPSHAKALSKFTALENFIFVLDGDQRETEVAQSMRNNTPGHALEILYLPSKSSPEEWVWHRLTQSVHIFSEALGFEIAQLQDEIAKLDSLYAGASSADSEIAKEKLYQLGEVQNRTASEICRIVARVEAEDPGSQLQDLVNDFKDAIDRWRVD